MAALLKMFENIDDQPATSEYYRLASYHGWPKRYCAHGQEIFPGWHRGYLLEFENSLRQADRELGGDGMIGLPYWDWSDFSSNEAHGEVLPKILRDTFHKDRAAELKWVRGLMKDPKENDGEGAKLWERG